MSARFAKLVACQLLWLGFLPSVGQGSVYTDWLLQETDPVIYWGQNEASGSVAYDAATVSGGVNNGTYQTAVPGAAGPRPSDGFSYMDDLNTGASVGTTAGGTRYLTLATGAGVPTDSYSMGFWFNSTVSAFTDRILQYVLTRGNDTTNTGIRDAVYIGGSHASVPTGKLAYVNNLSMTALTGNTLLQPNTWYHLLFVRDDSAAGKAKVYLNGKLEIQDLTNTWYGGGGEHLATTARTDFFSTIGMVGRYDEVAVWDRPLTSIEARTLYLRSFLDSPYVFSVLADTPEAYWRLNETTGNNTAYDETGRGHNFTYRTTPTRTGTAPDVGPRPVEFGGFEAGNNAPTLTGVTNSNGFLGTVTGVLGGQNDYTVEMWVRPGIDQNNYGDYLLHRNDTGTGTSGKGDFLGLHSPSGTGGSYGELYVYDGSSPIVSGTTILTTGEWYHVAMVREGNDLTVYLNGEEEISTTLAATGVWTAGTWTFGGRSDTTSQQQFSGNLDEIAIYGRALSAQEIYAHFYAANVPEPSTWFLLALGGLGLAAWRAGRRGR